MNLMSIGCVLIGFTFLIGFTVCLGIIIFNDLSSVFVQLGIGGVILSILLILIGMITDNIHQKYKREKYSAIDL